MDILKIPPKPAEAMYNIEKLTKEELVALKCVLAKGLYHSLNVIPFEKSTAQTLIDKVNQIL